MSKFTDRWVVRLGRIAYASFVVVMVSGVFLLFHYDPSTELVRYAGPFAPLRGLPMSKALASTLAITFEVRGGLLMRQVHHWGTLVMAAALMLLILRVFFIAGYRQRRRWLVLIGLLLTTMAAGFTGAVLPDDLLSGTSLSISDGVVRSIPFVGTWLSSVLFGDSVITKMFGVHVVVLPVVLVVLFAMVARGLRSRAAAVRRTGAFLMVTAVLVVMGAIATVNPVWLYGPADPANASAGASPEWYLAVVDGALRLVPPDWEFVWLGRTWAVAVLLPVAVVGLFFLVVAVWPWLERWLPSDDAFRAGMGVAGMTFYGVLWIAAAADTIAVRFHLTIETVLHLLQFLVLAGPVIAFLITRALARVPEREPESGVVIRTPDGGYEERSVLLDGGAEPAEDAVGVGTERVVID